MFQCEYCNYASIHNHNVTKHVKRMHANNTAPPTTINTHSTQLGSHNIRTNEPTLQCESDSAEIFQPNTVPIENYNKVVEIAQEWKKECEIKDNGIHARNEFLTANNSKLQDEYVKNKILIEQNQNIMEKNNQLELEKESLVEDGNNKVSAMGQVMGNLIHKYKQLKIKKKNAAKADICQIRFFIYQNPCLFGGKILILGVTFLGEVG